MKQAAQVGLDELYGHLASKERRFVERWKAQRARRATLIYTRAGVLDMTRRRITRQSQVEQIVGYIEGGAK